MLVWIASYSRSGNTLFRVALTHVYDVNTYAAFHAGENLIRANIQGFVNHKELPEPLRSAIEREGRHGEEVKAALETLDADEQIYIFKTHASPLEVFGVAGKTILVVRDGRDSLASFANYFIDSGANMTDLKYRLSAALRTPISTGDWVKFGKAAGRTTYKGLLERFGQRQRMVSSQLDRLLASESTYLNWSAMNRAWMQFDPEPVVVHFDDLVSKPAETVTGAIEALDLKLPSKGDQKIPTFDELRAQYPTFFRKGKAGDWKNWFTDQQERTFWEDSQDIMQQLGFDS